MAKFCGKCGTRLDETTGLCPNCHENKIKGLNQPDNQTTEVVPTSPPPSETEPAESKRKQKKRLRAEKKAEKKLEKKRLRAEKKAAKKQARKQCKIDRKAERKARKKEKWAAKPWWGKMLNILLRCIMWLLMLVVAAATAVLILGRCGILEIPTSDEVFISLGLKERYHVDAPDADEYFENNSTVVSVVDAATSADVLTEKQVSRSLTGLGFTDYPITSDYTMDGTYYRAAEISQGSGDKHPVYETYYVTKDDHVWMIFVINGKVMANPVSYNLQSGLGVQVIISETESVISYDGTTNQFYETVPNASELVVKVVDKIDAQTLETLTFEVIDGL